MAKRSFFDGLGHEAFALFNTDDPYGLPMAAATPARCVAYGFAEEMQRPSSWEDGYVGRNLRLESASLTYEVEGKSMTCGLSGQFNAYNTLAVYAAGRLLGLGKDDLLKGFATLTPPPGRMQSITGPEGRLGIVDYAHTPDALEQVLKALGDIKEFNARLITVVGCGGDRDRGKRPLMADAAYRYSDAMIFTSDNPRHEDPDFILHEMMEGIPADLGTVLPSNPESGKKVVIRHADRAEAIRMAVQMTASEDILLVAGKGHETYQEIQGVRYPFSDADQLHMEFELLANSIQNSKSKV